MPNHVSTRTVFAGSRKDLDAIQALIGKDFDFNRIIPRPEGLKNSVSPTYVEGSDQCNQHPSVNPRSDWYDPLTVANMKKSGQIISQEEHDRRMKECGANNWYEWCKTNWGTKWSAYPMGDEIQIERDANSLEVQYCTAWTPATPVLEAIVKKFPEVTIESEYADEGGFFVCKDIFKNDVSKHYCYEWTSEDGRKIREKVGYLWDDVEAGME